MCPLYILKDDEDVRQRCKPEFIYQELVMSPFCCSLQWHSIWIIYYLIKTSKSRLHENKIGVAERDKLHHKKMVEIWSNSLAHSFRGKETIIFGSYLMTENANRVFEIQKSYPEIHHRCWLKAYLIRVWWLS